ncbi:hypothetical protein CapIbe_000876 [Capra ibex]
MTEHVERYTLAETGRMPITALSRIQVSPSSEKNDCLPAGSSRLGAPATLCHVGCETAIPFRLLPARPE